MPRNGCSAAPSDREGRYFGHLAWAGIAPADTAAPAIDAVSPADGQVGVSTAASVSIAFNEAMDGGATEAALQGQKLAELHPDARGVAGDDGQLGGTRLAHRRDHRGPQADTAPTGVLADYVSGTSGDGEVRVRVRCTRTSSGFYASGDLLRAVYERP